MKTQFLTWLKIAGIALIAFLCVSWVAALKIDVNTTWCECVWAFVVSYFLLERYSSRGNSSSLIVSATTVGFLICLIIVQLADICGSLWSIICDASLILGIVMSAVYHKNKNIAVLILAAVVLILFNSFCVPEWSEYIKCLKTH